MPLSLSMLDVVEIVRPIDSGMTRPYLCRLEDGALYAVKGRAALPQGLIAEVVAGQLGRLLGLPIPPFAIAHMPRSLLRHHGDAGVAQAVGEGPVFASAWQDSVQPITPLTLATMDQDLLARLYVFDHWIANGDRSLTEHGGNPNLFVRLGDGATVAIDHNLAFAADYDPEKELPVHAGRLAWEGVADHAAFFATMRADLERARVDLPAIVETLPEEWLEEQPRLADRIATILDRLDDIGFWVELA